MGRIGGLENMRIDTHYIVFYLSDGHIVEYDLLDPGVPLPPFRSLVVKDNAKQ